MHDLGGTNSLPLALGTTVIPAFAGIYDVIGVPRLQPHAIYWR